MCCQSFDFKRPSVATLREKPVEIAETEGRLLKALEGRPRCA